MKRQSHRRELRKRLRWRLSSSRRNRCCSDRLSSNAEPQRACRSPPSKKKKTILMGMETTRTRPCTLTMQLKSSNRSKTPSNSLIRMSTMKSHRPIWPMLETSTRHHLTIMGKRLLTGTRTRLMATRWVTIVRLDLPLETRGLATSVNSLSTSSSWRPSSCLILMDLARSQQLISSTSPSSWDGQPHRVSTNPASPDHLFSQWRTS